MAEEIASATVSSSTDVASDESVQPLSDSPTATDTANEVVGDYPAEELPVEEATAGAETSSPDTSASI